MLNETKEEKYIDYLSGHGDFDDWYNAMIKDQLFKGKTFEELDSDCQLWVCKHFKKDWLERD